MLQVEGMVVLSSHNNLYGVLLRRCSSMKLRLFWLWC